MPIAGRPLALALVLAASTSLTPSTAAATDEVGARGRVIAVEINTAGSSEHPSRYGSISLRQANGKTVDYLWGGSTCPAQKLEPSQVQVLVVAHVERGKTWVTPKYTASEGGDRRCLVGFTLSV